MKISFLGTVMISLGLFWCLLITSFINHQIFSIARDWAKHVTWPNIPKVKLGSEKIARVAKKPPFGLLYLGILVFKSEQYLPR